MHSTTSTVNAIDAEILDQLRVVGAQIGDTPLIPLNRIHDLPNVKVFAKVEWQQLGGSVKARPAFNIIAEAILAGKLRPGMCLLDASSGNTAIAYASIANALGYGVTLCIPENASAARIAFLKALGAEIVYSSRFEGTDGAQALARELAEQSPRQYYYADQYNNDNNWRAHYKSTALEINEQTRGKVTHFVAGLGTTGTFTGTSRRLRELKPETELIALHPATAMHGLEGWKHMETAKVPGIYDTTIADLNLPVTTEEAYETLKLAARKEGLLLSPSAAANVAGALKVARNLEEGIVVTILPDSADKYMEVLNHLFG